MIHLRGCWPANGSKRAAIRSKTIDMADARRRAICNLVRETCDAEVLAAIISKREARLIQSQQYRQNGAP